MRKWVRQQFTSYVNCWLYLSVLLGLRGLNKQTERLQRADRNVLEHKVAVGRQRQSFDNRLGFFNRCGVHKEDHATGLILAEPELVDLAVEIEPQSVGDFLRQDPLPLLVRERLGKQTQSKNLHDCSPCSKVLRNFMRPAFLRWPASGARLQRQRLILTCRRSDCKDFPEKRCRY